MARAVRSATLEFGVVSIPVSLKKAADSRKIEMDNANADGHALSQKYVDSVTGEDCTARDGWRKGVFGSKPDVKDRSTWGEFHEIDDDAIRAIEDATKIEDFSIEGFIPLDEVPFERAIGCYYLTPQKGQGAAAGKSMKLLASALNESGCAGILKLVVQKRQYPAVVYERNGGLFVNTLVWATDFSGAKEASEAIEAAAEPDSKMVAMAVQLIQALQVDRDALDAMDDDLLPLQEELVSEALAGKPVKVPAKKTKEPVVDGLEAALQASLAQTGKQKAKAPKVTPRAKAAAKA